MDTYSITQSRKASIVEYLLSREMILLKEGRQFRVKNYSGLIVSDNMWYSHTLSKGGNTLDFLMEFEQIEFKTAVEMLSTKTSQVFEINKGIERKQLLLPKRNTNDKRVLAYLVKTRSIDTGIIIPLLKKGHIYEAVDTHNCVFTLQVLMKNYQLGTLCKDPLCQTTH